MTLNKKWDGDQKGNRPKWQEEEVYRWKQKKCRNIWLHIFLLCIVSKCCIQETHNSFKFVISCECFKELMRKKIIVKHPSPPSVILHHSIQKECNLIFQSQDSRQCCSQLEKSKTKTLESPHMHIQKDEKGRSVTAQQCTTNLFSMICPSLFHNCRGYMMHLSPFANRSIIFFLCPVLLGVKSFSLWDLKGCVCSNSHRHITLLYYDAFECIFCLNRRSPINWNNNLRTKRSYIWLSSFFDHFFLRWRWNVKGPKDIHSSFLWMG